MRFFFSVFFFNVCELGFIVNGVTHRPAHFASLSYIDDFWFEASIIEDISNCTRGLSPLDA